MEIHHRYVIDANVGIKLFLKEEDSERATSLFSYLASDPPAELFIPDLFYIECTNILLKYIRRFGLSLEQALEYIDDLKRLSLGVTPTHTLLTDAIIVGKELNLTAYDACYVVLAQRLDIPLITADQKIFRMYKNSLWLGDLDMVAFDPNNQP